MDFTSEKSIKYLNLLYDNIVHVRNRSIPFKLSMDNFKIVSQIGQGNNGKVYLVKLEGQEKLFAMKVINKPCIVDQNLFRYIRFEKFIMEQLDNKFLLKLEGFFQTDRNIFLIMEYMKLDLFNFIQEKVEIGEEETCFYSICIAVAIDVLHKYKFCYRDLKPENILLGDDGYPVLCDFGLTNLLFPSHKAYTLCGTAEYFAQRVSYPILMMKELIGGV